MKIFVCIKQVPDTETKVKIAGDGKSLDPAGVKWVMNPYDEYAVEEAIKIREQNAGSQIFAITVGPKKRAIEVVRTALAMGADEGLVVDAPENIDASVTAELLAKAITAEGPAQLVLSGKLAIDDNASAVSQMLAENLGIGHTTVVSKLTWGPEAVTAERDIEGGSKEVVRIKLPAVIAANKGLNMPRYASLQGIMKAKKKTVKEIDGASLGVKLEPKTPVLGLEMPPEKPAVKMLSGDAATQAKTLVESLRNEAKVI